ncbi:hypothetical protein E2C01_080132 [Portunus trituberculatus]|uniref:Uncharacterized protein n=1 Tax=Portunus trituberculatus TaxID=210409 RepID=A0A5B7ING9_PORTR|nr:hypothetical protein [Portunus trituberculatus]
MIIRYSATLISDKNNKEKRKELDLMNKRESKRVQSEMDNPSLSQEHDRRGPIGTHDPPLTDLQEPIPDLTLTPIPHVTYGLMR